jgi:pimeloyl-ACP methyl ester carboxylesterase
VETVRHLIVRPNFIADTLEAKLEAIRIAVGTAEAAPIAERERKIYVLWNKGHWAASYVKSIGTPNVLGVPMPSVSRIRVRAGDLDVACHEVGQGPLVLLCHGFPELGFSWRHQLGALADAGFRAVAPDLRGYGDTAGPAEPEDCSFDRLINDLVSLVAALGEQQAVLVGHDFGAFLAWHAAAVRPDIFTRVACLSVPYPTFLMGTDAPTKVLLKRIGSEDHYILYFQRIGGPEAELEADVADTLLRTYWSSSGEEPDAEPFAAAMPRGSGFLAGTRRPSRIPSWLTEDELAVYVDAFKRRGFAGPLAWYRAIDSSWENLARWRDAKVSQPALFMIGACDPLLAATTGLRKRMLSLVPRLSKEIILPGCGHWVQQERPLEVNRALTEFLSESL